MVDALVSNTSDSNIVSVRSRSRVLFFIIAFFYDIWGDTVNTAARIENAGEVAKVNISHATYELLKKDPQFTFKSRGKIEAKGKGEMEMYFVQKN